MGTPINFRVFKLSIKLITAIRELHYESYQFISQQPFFLCNFRTYDHNKAHEHDESLGPLGRFYLLSCLDIEN